MCAQVHGLPQSHIFKRGQHPFYPIPHPSTINSRTINFQFTVEMSALYF